MVDAWGGIGCAMAYLVMGSVHVGTIAPEGIDAPQKQPTHGVSATFTVQYPPMSMVDAWWGIGCAMTYPVMGSCLSKPCQAEMFRCTGTWNTGFLFFFPKDLKTA